MFLYHTSRSSNLTLSPQTHPHTSENNEPCCHASNLCTNIKNYMNECSCSTVCWERNALSQKHLLMKSDTFIKWCEGADVCLKPLETQSLNFHVPNGTLSDATSPVTESLPQLCLVLSAATKYCMIVSFSTVKSFYF